MSSKVWFWPVYWLVVAGLFAACIVVVVFYTPTEITMLAAQKIFYLHLPVAINTLLACTVCFIASIGFLWQRRQMWDDLASAAASVAVVLCSVVLLTGMIWGHSAWKVWWTWSPRLTFSLVLWLLYVAYVMIRPSIPSRSRRALVSAVYGVVIFLDVPLVHLSTQLMPQDIHPASMKDMDGRMWLTLALWFIPVTLLTVGLIVTRYRLARRETLLAQSAAEDASAQPAPPDSPATEPSGLHSTGEYSGGAA